jgi:hypothetical protein
MRALPLACIQKHEPWLRRKNVSRVARSPRGFLTAYKKAGGKLSNMSPEWQRKRRNFLKRHLAQVRSNREPPSESGTVDPESGGFDRLGILSWQGVPGSEPLDFCSQ